MNGSRSENRVVSHKRESRRPTGSERDDTPTGKGRMTRQYKAFVASDRTSVVVPLESSFATKSDVARGAAPLLELRRFTAAGVRASTSNKAGVDAQRLPGYPTA